MATRLPSKILKNNTIYANRVNRIGQASEITIPDIEMVKEEVTNAGMTKKRQIMLGVFEALMLTFKETALDPQLLLLHSKPDTEYMVVGVIEDADGGNQQNVTLYYRGDMTKLGMGSWKVGDMAENEYEVCAHYLKFEIGTDEIYEIDDFDCKIGGVSIFNYSGTMING